MPGPAGCSGAGVAPGRRGPAPETSARTVQNVLFVLGGLLLGIGAIVFTVVAWPDLGIGARAAILGGFTLVTLAHPAARDVAGADGDRRGVRRDRAVPRRPRRVRVWATDLGGVRGALAGPRTPRWFSRGPPLSRWVTARSAG